MKKGTSKQSMGTVALIAFALVALGVQWVQAQDIKIDTRPLTYRELNQIATNATQTANGTHVVGLGQPIYLDLLVEKGTVVTQVVWTLGTPYDLDELPINDSNAEITDSPLPMSLPTYDSIDRVTFDIVDRAMIVPDKRGTYPISVQAYSDSGILEADIEVVGSAFIGKDNGCYICHTSKKPLFETTLHSVALKDNINDPSGHFQEFCIACHALGYDPTPGAVNGGFDDVADQLGWEFPPVLATNNWDDLPDDLKEKSNVQCENCHGPGQLHYRMLDASKIGVSLSAGTCGQCHDAPGHHVKNFEWGNSIHGQTTVDRTGSCAGCHTTAGFIDANDPGMLFGEVVSAEDYATFKEGITCAACHDPHAQGEQIHQLRNLLSVEFANGDVITEGGAGLVCMSCHKSRREAKTYANSNITSTHWGPHYGTQGDMLMGINAYEYDQDMPSSRHGIVIEESCAECHLQDTQGMSLPEYAQNKIGGHSFMLAYDDGTNAPIHLTEACSSCHGEIEDFDFGGEDYNLNGIVEGVQSEIEGLMHDLGMLLPPVGDPHIGLHDSTEGYDTLPISRAVYNYLFVEADGSHGVHNPKYAAAILRSSIEDLKGGIDIDRDGLVDSWEIEHFGDLTSQSGDDDYDGDGLTNAQEQNIGTDPTMIDSDGDGYSDIIEVQGGSDPLDIASVPTGDMQILPAAEVGYMPKATGTVVRIQSLDSLNGGGWEDLGPAQTNSGSWVYALDSMRGNTNRFYRGVEE